MKLSETWFMEGYIDFELQKYRLLAYLQEVNKYFTETKLYPQLSDVVFHYNNLVAFRDSKKLMQDSFPRRIEQVDMQRLQIVYEEMLADNEVMQELERITNYALDEMKSVIDNGAGIYDFIEKQLSVQPVGILPLYKNEGYMLLRCGNNSDIHAYNYTISLFEHKDARYKGLRMHYLDSWKKSIVNTYEQVKKDIIRLCRVLPNPAVYSIEFPHVVPLNETLLPIAKRVLIRQIESIA